MLDRFFEIGSGQDRDGAERADRDVGGAVRAGDRLRHGAPLDRRRRRRHTSARGRVPEGGMGAVADAIAARRAQRSAPRSGRTPGSRGSRARRSGRPRRGARGRRGAPRAGGRHGDPPEDHLPASSSTASELPPDFVRDIENWKSRSGVVKINLRDRPAAASSRRSRSSRTSAAAFELAHSVAYLETGFEEARAGAPSTLPFCDGVVPDVARPHARARGDAHRLAVHAVGAARVEREAAHARSSRPTPTA